jgi:asparagine synthase (glutamine-hydrolysing)
MLEEPEAAAVYASFEENLLHRYWGGYVGAVPSGRGVRVLRDPSGLLPCYYSVTRAATIFASDVETLLATGLVRPEIDWAELVRHHYTRELPTAETVLRGVRELLPGFTVEANGLQAPQRMRWCPWDYVQSDRDPRGENGPELLRRIVTNSVQCWSSRHAHLLVSVSGGLDSSIVAACLAKTGRNIQCITLYTDDPAGDERAYARALCTHLDLPLTERSYRVEDIDIDLAISPHLPRPIGRTLAQAYEKAHLDLARAEGIDAFVTGNGGDNVFGYSQSAAAIADRFICEGPTLGVLRTIRDVCRQTGCGPIEAVRAAVRTSRRRRYSWPPSAMFLDRGAYAGLTTEALDHPWLNSPVGASPGKAAHIAALLRFQHHLDPTRGDFAPLLTPLVSQPVVEALGRLVLSTA